MALELPHSVFFHIPKTGGTWVRNAIANSKIPTTELSCRWHTGLVKSTMHTCMHNTAIEVKYGTKFTFAFVRNPLHMYQSYWSYKQLKGNSAKNYVDTQYMHDSFADFVEVILEAYPNGWVTELLQKHVGVDGKRLNFVGRQEYLVEDTLEALERAGEAFDVESIRSTPRCNIASGSEKMRKRCIMSDDLRRRVEKKEQWAMETFGYAQPSYTVAFS